MYTYTIVHDIPGRIRVRYGRYVLDSGQAKLLQKKLQQWTMVKQVEVNSTTGSVLFFYEGSREALLAALSAVSIADLKKEAASLAKTVPAADGALERKKISSAYKRKFFHMLVRRYAVRWFLPYPLRKLVQLRMASRYFRAGAASLKAGRMDVALLDATSIAVSMLGGNFNTAGDIMFMLSVSELLEDYTKKKTKLQLRESLSLKFDKVWIADGDCEREIAMSELKKGDVAVVMTGTMVPVDGEIVQGEALVNEASFTGEPLSKQAGVGDSVFAGTVVEEGRILVRVRNLQKDSRISRIVDMIDSNESLKASIQSKAEHLADAIVPFSFLGFLGLLALTRSVRRATSILLVDYSCAIKLSTSISIISAMKEASVHFIMVKGGKYLETISEADTIVFDKTGTLTNARPSVKQVVATDRWSREEVLKIAACLEEHFPHSVANAIVHQAELEGLKHKEEHAKVEYIIAHGIATTLYGEHTVIGSDHFVFEDEKVEKTDAVRKKIAELEQEGAGTMIYLAIGGTLAGIISIYDPLKEEAKEVVEQLRACGISHVVMLTGDCRSAAEHVAQELGIREYRYGVLPEDKAEYIKKLKQDGHTVIMVGDGVNDTPALSSSDVSISMQDSSDIARELADITLTSDNLRELLVLRQLSVGAMRRIHVNYRGIVAFNSGLIVLGALGVLAPNLSALLHNGSTFAISAASTRPLLSRQCA